jgi:hypothetical protein
MRRYHFDLLDTNSVTDATGAILDDDNHARKVALDLARGARQGRPDLIGQGYEIRVRSENGEEISRLALDQPPKGGDTG